MCGIAGLFRRDNDAAPISLDRLKAATASLAHRGPDDEQFYFDSSIAFGFRRLSIVDVAGGRQPVSNEDGSVWVLHNGEIYNHDDLRLQLLAEGHVFLTRSDAETLVHGYEAWGLDGLLERLNGMFAFAIWDSRSRSLHLARDRFGMKPLFFAERAGLFGFASELNALRLLLPAVDEIDETALSHYIRLGYVPSPRTMLRDVSKLPAAHCMTATNGRLRSRQYWSLSYIPSDFRSERLIVAEFRERISEAVKSHLMGEVTLGALLSGGVDSTTIVAHMRQVLGRPFPVVTLGFGGESFDERERAAASARQLELSSQEIGFSDSSLEDYPSMLHALGEPHSAMTFAAQFQLFAETKRRGMKVVLTGEGADELLGGYSWHWSHPASRLIAGDPASVARFYLDALTVHPIEQVKNLLLPDLKKLCDNGADDDLLSQWTHWAEEAEAPDAFSQLLWLQSRTRLPDYVNTIFDRMSMASSVEARPPFQDHSLWSFCAGVPARLKLRGSYPNQSEKYLLRESGRGIVPEAARTARKAPLRVPYENWIAKTPLPPWAEESLAVVSLRAVGLFCPAAVGTVRLRARAGDVEAQRLCRFVLATQTWFRSLTS